MASSRRGFFTWCTAALLSTGCLPDPPASVGEDPEQAINCLCSPQPPVLAAAPGESVASPEARVLAPGATAGELASLVAANTDFAATLHRISKPGQNLFFSPISISQALSMVYVGARGTTESQMAQVLRFPLSQERLHPTMNALDLALQVRTGTMPPGATPPTFRVVNGSWGQKGLAFEPAFLDVLARQYGAGMRVVDFTTEAPTLRDRINLWVEEQTESRIKELLSTSAVTPNTRLMLVNALYFKGAWAQPFRKSATRDESFRALDGVLRPVPMMRGASGSYMAGDGFESIAMPYVGGDFRMVIVLPAAGRFAEVESRLSSAFLEGIRTQLQSRYLDIRLPRFQVESALPLIPSLTSLGMEDAFSPYANFSGLVRSPALSITSVSHKSFVSVNEEGTEAAAATEVGAGPPSMPQTFLVDRPFLFLIEHVATKNVLFLGRYVTP